MKVRINNPKLCTHGLTGTVISETADTVTMLLDQPQPWGNSIAQMRKDVEPA